MENSHCQASAPNGAMVFKRRGTLCEQARSLPRHFNTTPIGVEACQWRKLLCIKLR